MARMAILVDCVTLYIQNKANINNRYNNIQMVHFAVTN